jgi:hypothetical protein
MDVFLVGSLGWDGPLRRILGGNGRFLGWVPGLGWTSLCVLSLGGMDVPLVGSLGGMDLSFRCIPGWESTFLTSSNVLHFYRFPDQERVLSHFTYKKLCHLVSGDEHG